MASPVYVRMEETRLSLDRYVLPIILVVGNMTNLANIYLFSRRNLRQNPCSWYFISLSVAHLCMLDILGLSRILMGWMNYDYATNNSVYCKIRSYLFTVSMVLSRQFICLISIDRWLVTSPNAWLRNQSSLRVTRYLIFGSILFWLIYDSHALIGYQTNFFGCYPSAGTTYATFASVDTIVTTLLPTVSSRYSLVSTADCIHSILLGNYDYLQLSCTIKSSVSRFTPSRPSFVANDGYY